MLEQNHRMKNLKNYDIDSLLAEVKQGRKLICFGAGKAIDTFINTFSEDYMVENYIDAIADNDSEKQETMYAAGKREIPIQSPDRLFGAGGTSLPIIVLITSRNLASIYDNLQKYPRLMNTSVAFYGYIIDHYVEKKITDGAYDCEIVNEDGIQIPKVIHYCWFGKSKIPDRYRAWMESWKKYCPDYEIVEWNEDNYDVKKNRYMAEAYESKKWQFVSDYARLDIIYRHGGVYMDTDVELIKSLDPLMHQQAFAGFESLFSVASGLGFGAVPQHSGILMLRDDYHDKNFIREDGTLNMTPCPCYQTECLKRMGLRLDGTFQSVCGINVYPQTFFFPLLPYNKRLILRDCTFSIHHYDGSWIDEAAKKMRTRNAKIYNYIV